MERPIAPPPTMIVFLTSGTEDRSGGTQVADEALAGHRQQQRAANAAPKAMPRTLSFNTYVDEASLGWGEYEVNEEA